MPRPMILRVSIPILYQANVARGGFLGRIERYWLSLLYRIGFGFVGIVVQDFSFCGMDPIPILYQNPPLKVILF